MGGGIDNIRDMIMLLCSVSSDLVLHWPRNAFFTNTLINTDKNHTILDNVIKEFYFETSFFLWPWYLPILTSNKTRMCAFCVKLGQFSIPWIGKWACKWWFTHFVPKKATLCFTRFCGKIFFFVFICVKEITFNETLLVLSVTLLWLRGQGTQYVDGWSNLSIFGPLYQICQ